MKRKTLIAGLGVAGLGVAATLLLRAPERGSHGHRDSQPPPVGKLAEGSFDTIEVVRGGGTIIVTREGKTYKIVRPMSYPADQALGKQAFEALANMEWMNPVSEQKSRHEELEVDDDSLRVIVKRGERTLADFHVGKAINKQAMVRVEGQSEVWSASGLERNLLDKDLVAWRDKTITQFDPSNAEQLLVTSKNGSLIMLSRQAGPDGKPGIEWKVTQATVKVEPLDKAVPREMVNQLAALRASGFADDAKPEETGLDSPELVVAVSLRDGTRQSVLIGKNKGEDEVYVQRADAPQVFVVKKYGLDKVTKPPVDFRGKTLCDLPADEITEIQVTQPKDSFLLARQESGWKLLRPSGIEIDESKVARILAGLSGWKAQGYAEDASPRTTGLDRPVARVLVKTGDKSRSCQIGIGGETPDKNALYVAVTGLPDVFVVPKWSVGQVVVRLDVLKKS